ncbi:MAG: serine/threonine protein kinase [Anaerolineae bacterium]|nr:serine/threonine protein kinase [Anaerolineae bacterium]
MSDIANGTIIGGYQILEEVGQGGMATVYRAHQLSITRDVAVKVLPRQFLRQANSLERFKQEANIVARLEHRAIVPVYDYGEYDGLPYIVMRYMDGGSAGDLLVTGPLTPARALEVLQQIAPGLDYAHQQGVLHRDLKPSNIMLDANGDAYVTDFGIARLLGDNAPSLTTSGVVGTPSYMSPEQAQGHDLDGRSDVYALGVVLFELLTGKRPFEGETPYSVAVKHVTATPPSACMMNPQLSRAVEQVLFKVLEKHREQRYQTASELAEGLKRAVDRRPVASAPPASMSETDPALERALREGSGRPQDDPSHYLSHPMPRAAQQRAAQPRRSSQPRNSHMRSSARGQGARAYPRHSRKSRPRRRRSLFQADWLTWMILLGLLGIALLAVGVGGVYFLVLDTTAQPESGPQDYPATAIYKMTATKRAITDQLASLTPELSRTPTVHPAASSTIPPTNTSYAARLPSPTRRILPLVVTDLPAK